MPVRNALLARRFARQDSFARRSAQEGLLNEIRPSRSAREIAANRRRQVRLELGARQANAQKSSVYIAARPADILGLVPLPTLAPVGDYFLTAGLGSSGPTFSVYGSDPSRAPSVGDPVSIPPPTVSASSVPEPGTFYLSGVLAGVLIVIRRSCRQSTR